MELVIVISENSSNLFSSEFWAVVANAGVLACYGPDEWNTIDDFKFAIEVNTFGVIRCVQVNRRMKKASDYRDLDLHGPCEEKRGANCCCKLGLWKV